MTTREKIINTARTLFYSRGYQATSIQEIIDAVDIARGTFYHHFQSKEELLEELVGQESAGTREFLQKIVEQPQWNAVEKLNQFFLQLNSWKAEQPGLMLATFEALYKRDNLILREKIVQESTRRIAPLLEHILEQGREEGLFSLSDPAYTAELIFTLGSGLSRLLAEHFLQLDRGEGQEDRGLKLVMAYQEAIARILGVREGEVELIDGEDLQQLQEAILNKKGGQEK